MSETDSGVKWFNTIFYPQRKTARAARYEEGVLPRLRQAEITLFTPWGPRYHWKERGTEIGPEDKEIKVLDFLRRMLDEWKENMPCKNFNWLFLGADLYGTRINGLPREVVLSYYSALERQLNACLPGAVLYLWSGYDEQAERYRTTLRQEFSRFFEPNLVERAEKTAEVMGLTGNTQTYLVERRAEAMLIEDLYAPIKISCVGRYKDDGVDGDLPRLYFLPESLWAPWI